MSNSSNNGNSKWNKGNPKQNRKNKNSNNQYDYNMPHRNQYHELNDYQYDQSSGYYDKHSGYHGYDKHNGPVNSGYPNSSYGNNGVRGESHHREGRGRGRGRGRGYPSDEYFNNETSKFAHNNFNGNHSRDEHNSKESSKTYETETSSKTNFKNKSEGNDPPVPAPRKSLLHNADDSSNQSKQSFSQDYTQMRESEQSRYFDSESQGAKKKTGKKKKSDDSNDSSVWFCTTCVKVIHGQLAKNHGNNMHEILPMQEGIQKLQLKEVEKLENIEEKIHNVLRAEDQMDETLELWLNVMLDPLLKIFECFRDSSTESRKGLLDTADELQKIKSAKQCQTLVELMSYQTHSKALASTGEDLLIRAQEKPLWAISTWFKVSLGLMLQSGKPFMSFTKRDSSVYAPLSIQGDRILFSCFRRNSPDKETILLPYNFLNCIFEKEHSGSFMKISYDGKEEGFVFMRVDSETFWGKQFGLMCTGEGGPSYRENRFFRACQKGKAGHHIWTGDYSKGNGNGGEQVLQAPVKCNPKAVVKGLLSARFGYEDRSTIFRIYLTGSESLSKMGTEEVTDEGAFGYVEDGLDVLAHVASKNDITKTLITDVGRIMMMS